MKTFATIWLLITGGMAVGQTGINCSDSTFWAMHGGTLNILQFQLTGSGAISSPSPVSIPPPGWSLAFCNNLSGGTFSPTFYSDDGVYTAYHYNGSSWVADSTSIHYTQNAAGSGNYLYYYDQNSTLIERFDGTSFTTVYNDTSGLKIACADLATDDSGNIWILRSIDPFEAIYIDVISPSGVALKRYNISLNTLNAYGVMLMNSVLYVGLGDINIAHPNTLIPFTFTTDSAIQGAPISMPVYVTVDLASCYAGAPVLFQCGLAPPVISSNQSQICASDSASVCAPANFAAYHWNNGSTTSCITTSLAGNYYVTVTDNSGCTAESNHLGIAIYPLPDDSISANKTIFCSGDSAQVCAPPGFATYNWNTGENTACVKAKLAGNYYVTVTDVNGCTAESNHLAISVYPLPPVSISVNGDTLSVYGAATQQWYLNDSAISGATTPIYIANQSGSYTVAVTDTNGCVATSSAVIISGVDNLSEEDVVSVYQLTDGSWQLTVGNNWIGSIVEVFDTDGRVVFKSEIRNSKSEITADVAKGVYLLRVSSTKGSVVRKLVRL